MKNLTEFTGKIGFLLTDIDDTLTDEGRLGAEAYQALWNLKAHGIKVIPVTGRPAGWCELIARMWPVDGVVGENGGFYFRYHQKKMHRVFFYEPKVQRQNREKLRKIEAEILSQVPGSALASDQFCRLMDLAIDFCEDIEPLSAPAIQKIVSIFTQHGAQAKISSIHVNGWFGEYNKLTMSLRFLEEQFGLSEEESKIQCAFSGDSPNDEPMFDFFPKSFAVANIQNFISTLGCKPKFVSPSCGGLGFAEITRALISASAV
ncbi:MAG: HAD-IIB family hydrolase [Bdellovibrionaceae bacterium]|nr:HAD-IIB family hydrolase [Pseudobdellovibrionaceae bacterium]